MKILIGCLSNVPQASVCQRQSPSSSSSGLLHQPAGVSQNSVSIWVTALVGLTCSKHKYQPQILFFFKPHIWIQITLPASQVTAQLIGRTQTSSSTGAAATISQQAMLLGNRPPNCNQAQMYLRTQMVKTFSNMSSCFFVRVFGNAWLVCLISIFYRLRSLVFSDNIENLYF